MKSITISNRDKTLPLKVYLSPRVMGQMLLELQAITGVDGKLPYSAKSQLIESLVERWLDERKTERVAEMTTPTPKEQNVVSHS